jgi:hypothetical protein
MSTTIVNAKRDIGFALEDLAVRFPSAAPGDLEHGLGSGFLIQRSVEQPSDERPIGARFATLAVSASELRASAGLAYDGRELVFAIPKEPRSQIAPWSSIGRLARNSIPIAHPSVSKMHTLVRLDSDRYLLADAGSRNGTLLNGKAVPRYDRGEALVLKNGDVVQIGAVRLSFASCEGLSAILRALGSKKRT